MFRARRRTYSGHDYDICFHECHTRTAGSKLDWQCCRTTKFGPPG